MVFVSQFHDGKLTYVKFPYFAHGCNIEAIVEEKGFGFWHPLPWTFTDQLAGVNGHVLIFIHTTDLYYIVVGGGSFSRLTPPPLITSFGMRKKKSA